MNTKDNCIDIPRLLYFQKVIDRQNDDVSVSSKQALVLANNIMAELQNKLIKPLIINDIKYVCSLFNKFFKNLHFAVYLS